MKRRKAKARGRVARFGSRRALLSFALFPFAFFLLTACRQDMQDTPRYEVYEPSTFFDDGQASRPFVEGTVPRGERFRNADAYQYTGVEAGAQGGAGNTSAASGTTTGAQAGGVGAAGANVQSTQSGGAQTTGDVNVRGNVAGGIPAGAQAGAGVGEAGAGQAATFPGPDRFPFQITEAEVNRGQERFNVYCGMCHGPTGEGDGMIVRRGFRRPPSFHEDRLQAGNSNAAHFFDVISNGGGAMPSYADMIPWEDRWRIIAYVRALQLSRRANVSDVPENRRGQIGQPGAPAAPREEGGSHR
ncbi:MAG TPA: cytochrome c [Pyrinomonadaceae bacterium]|nr:cytochrome c [Pyrinomonadaceae bacterium]